MKTDTQLRDDVQAELSWDPAFKASDIGVIVKDGVVTLTGHLSSHAEKYAAERAVQRVHGVKAVAVEMTVKLPFGNERTDADIAMAAERALEWNVLVPDGRIRPMVEKGWLTLQGEVEWGYQRSAAEGAVRDLIGGDRRVQSREGQAEAEPRRRGKEDPRRAFPPGRPRGPPALHQRRRFAGHVARRRAFLGRARRGARRRVGHARRLGRGERPARGRLSMRVALVSA